MSLDATLRVDAQCEAKDINGCWWAAVVISLNRNNDDDTYALSIEDGQHTVWDYVPRDHIRMRAAHEPEYNTLLQQFKEAEEQKDATACDRLQKRISYLTAGNWEPIAKGEFCEVKNKKTDPWTVVEYGTDTERQYSHIRHSRSVRHPLAGGARCEGLDVNGNWWEITITSAALTDVGYVYSATVSDASSTLWDGLHQDNIRSLSERTQPAAAIRKETSLPKREKSLAEVEELERQKWRELPSALAAAPATSPHCKKSKKTAGTHSRSAKKSSSRNDKKSSKSNHKTKDKHKERCPEKAARSPPAVHHPDGNTHLLSHQMVWVENELGKVIDKKAAEITITTPGTYFVQPEIVPNCGEGSCRVEVVRSESKGIRLGVAAAVRGETKYTNHVQGGLPSRIGVGTVWMDVKRMKSTISWRRLTDKRPTDHPLPEQFAALTLRYFITLGRGDSVIVHPPLVSPAEYLPPSLASLLHSSSAANLPPAVAEAVAHSAEAVLLFSNILPILAAAVCSHARRANRKNNKKSKSKNQQTCCAHQ